MALHIFLTLQPPKLLLLPPLESLELLERLRNYCKLFEVELDDNLQLVHAIVNRSKKSVKNQYRATRPLGCQAFTGCWTFWLPGRRGPQVAGHWATGLLLAKPS